jgi:hypothetical protein
MDDLPTLKRPFWSPSYAKPMLCAGFFGLVVFGGLHMAVNAIAHPPEAKLLRGPPVSGKYVIENSGAGRKSPMSKIGNQYVYCTGSAYGAYVCDKWHEGRQVVAERVSMPGLYGDQLVVSEIREGDRLLHARSDAELLEKWKSRSFDVTLFLTLFVVVSVAVLISLPSLLGFRSKKA